MGQETQFTGRAGRLLTPLVAALAAISAGPGVVRAQDLGFSADVTVELQNDAVVDADDPAAEINDFFATVESDLALTYAEGSGIFAHLTFEPVRDPVDDRFLEDHGLYVEELYFAHDFGLAAVRLGKFNPAFGMAFDEAPGIYGVDFAEDYELTEKIGAGIDIPLRLGGGEAVLSIAAYFADTGVLSNSAFTERGNLDEADGGVSNTESPESVSAELAGVLGGTHYNLALRYQERGRGDAADEKGVLLGLRRAVTAGRMPVSLLAEAAWFPDFDGGRQSAAYATLGVEAEVARSVLVSAAYGLRDLEGAETDHLATVSVGYEVTEEAVVSVGYRYGREGGEDSHVLGLLFTYDFHL